jgi:hypothetical protein
MLTYEESRTESIAQRLIATTGTVKIIVIVSVTLSMGGSCAALGMFLFGNGLHTGILGLLVGLFLGAYLAMLAVVLINNSTTF